MSFLFLRNLDSAYQLMFSEYPDIVTVPQMCKMLGGISLKTGYRLLKKGEIESFSIGRIYRIPKISILQYLGLNEESNA